MKAITSLRIKKFGEYLIAEEKSRNTVSKYIRDVTAFAKWLSGRTLTKGAVLEYKDQLRGVMRPRSVNSVLSSLNSFFEFCGRVECKVKMIKIQRSMFASPERELVKVEYERLLEAAKRRGERLHLLMQTICATGIRVSELQFITVESLASGRADITMKGKNRTVFIPQKICKALQRYADRQGITSGSVFVSKHGNPLDRSNIWKMLKSLGEGADVARRKIFPHNLRHLFAKTFYTMHKDIVRLADILGHSSVNTTRIYTMETGEIHRRQIQELGLARC